jgi:hypothetical protein
MWLSNGAEKMKRRKPQPQPDEMTFLEAVDLLRRIVDAANRDDHLQIFKLVGITDEIADQISSAQELYEIAAVRLATINRIARMEQ